MGGRRALKTVGSGRRTMSKISVKTKGISITKPLLTISEVAEILSISKFTVYRMINEGEIQATKVRGSIRIFGDSLEGYISGNIISE